MIDQTKRSPAKRRLGRGLSSLISSSIDPPATDSQYQPTIGEPIAKAPAHSAPPAAEALAGPAQIGVDRIAPNPYQPRREFDAGEMSDLVASIVQQGILQPLIVARSSRDEGNCPYVLVAGERRLRAAREAGLAAVPCVVRDASPQQMLEWALVENIQRADLNPVEKGQAYQQYIDQFRLTQSQAAERLGQPRGTIANYLRILELPDIVQEMVRGGRLSFGHAKVLAGVAESQRRIELARRAARRGLSVRQLEALVAAEGEEGAKTTRRGREKAPYIRDLEERLTRAVGTRVSIRPGRASNTGRVVVDYYSLEDFDRIAVSLGVTAEG